MQSCTLIAPAKINLYLEIIGDRSDGYHELAMILQSIDLADQIHIQKSSIDSIRRDRSVNFYLHCPTLWHCKIRFVLTIQLFG